MGHIKTFLIGFLVCCTVLSYAQFRLYEKGHDSYKAGKYDEAVKSLTEYLTKATRDKAIDIDVFYIRALSYYKQNLYKEAIPDFEETVLRGHTNKGNIYWFMAKCYDQLSNNDDAVNYYNNALRELKFEKPESRAKLLYERSQIYSRMGNIVQAVTDLKDGLQANPSNADIKAQLAKLEKDHPAASRQAEIASKPTVKNDAPKPEPAKKEADGKATGPVKTVTAKKTEAKVPETKPAVASNTEIKNSNTQSPETQVVKTDQPAISNPESKPEETAPSDRKAKNTKKTPGTKADQTVSLNESKAEEKSNAVMQPQASAAPTLADLYKEEKRYALVIGNSNYPKQIGVLRNPVNDATDIAQELKASNFEVQLLTDATYGQIRAALMRFKEKLDAGDREKTVGLFYYAGHGLQFEDENYLVPLDAAVEYQDDIPRYCFPIQRMVLSNMERANTRMNIVILDACRNNPFPSVNRSLDNSGLGEMKRARGSFIAYATAPGSVASDGSGRNGLYTQELLKAMKKPGFTIEQVFKEVRANVMKLSSNKQNTWDSSNIIGEFHFKY